MADDEWAAKMERLFDMSKAEQDAIADDLAPGDGEDVRRILLLSWGALRQHGIHTSRIRTLLAGAVPKIRQDADGGGQRHNRRHPAWIIIDNRFIRYGYFEVEGSPLAEWSPIDPDGPEPGMEDIASPAVLTIYNIMLLKIRLGA
jgi:hypothetical protein